MTSGNLSIITHIQAIHQPTLLFVSDNGGDDSSAARCPEHPNTPPKSPDLSSSQPFTLNDVHQFIDMGQGVVRAKAASSTPTPHCTRCHTPLDHPNPQASSAPLAPEALAQLFLKLIQAASTLPDSAEVAESVKLDAPGDAKRINWTTKVKRHIAAQRNQELRDAWLIRMSKFNAR